MLNRLFLRKSKQEKLPEQKGSNTHQENDLMLLGQYDVVVLMDDSTSMRGRRWEQAKEATEGLVREAAKYDKDGVDIHFLNNIVSAVVTSEEGVRSIFNRVGVQFGTPLGRRLGDLCNTYLSVLRDSTEEQRLDLKRRLILAVTDGVPNDKDEVIRVIANMSKELDRLGFPRTQFGIQFVQIGNDSWATQFLQSLDDDLRDENGVKVGRDIVDTEPYNGEDLTGEKLVKLLAGAINKRIDNRASNA